MLKEEKRKRINVMYFNPNGDIYRVEEEYVPSHYNVETIKRIILQDRVRYRDMDIVIMDSGDNVRPFFPSFLYKDKKVFQTSKGF